MKYLQILQKNNIQLNVEIDVSSKDEPLTRENRVMIVPDISNSNI